MLEFARKKFRSWYNVALWIGFISLIVFGLIYGGITSGFIGVIIGGTLSIFFGLFFVVITGGLVSTFLNVDENIEQLNKNFRLFLKKQNITLPEEQEKEIANENQNASNDIKKIKLSIYKNPNLNSDIILTLTQGEKVSIIEKGEKIEFVNDYWVKVMCENGLIGWCYLSSFDEWCALNNS